MLGVDESLSGPLFPAAVCGQCQHVATAEYVSEAPRRFANRPSEAEWLASSEGERERQTGAERENCDCFLCFSRHVRIRTPLDFLAGPLDWSSTTIDAALG